jgi:gamma-glutamyltranspeptidase
VRVDDMLAAESLEELLRTSMDGRPPAASRESTRPNGDTVAIVTADSEGRSVSLIQSTYHSFGSRILEPTTGVILHNRGGSFSLDPTSPNVLAPRKRPAHTLTPVLAERADERLVVGTMGGEMQPQILTQVLSRLLSGDSAQHAVSAPRWTVGAWDRGQPVDQINAESDVDESVRAAIEQWPGAVNWMPARAGEAGHSQAIRVTRDKFDVGTDPRADTDADA